MARLGSIGTQYFDDAGKPLVKGKLYFFESGLDIEKDTFADINLSIKNTNPVLLSAAGRQPNIFYGGSAKVILTDKDGVQIEVRDPVEAGSGATSSLGDYNNELNYSTGDIITLNGSYYVSIQNNNQGNNPETEDEFWTQIRFIRQWNENETYERFMIVVSPSGGLFASLQDNNFNNIPESSPSFWKPPVEPPEPGFGEYAAGSTYTTGDIVTRIGGYWVSIIPNNTGNTPETSPTAWTQIRFIRNWNANETYGEFQVVLSNTGLMYSSRVDNNQGNDPDSSGNFWKPVTEADAALPTSISEIFGIQVNGSGTYNVTLENRGVTRIVSSDGSVTPTPYTPSGATLATGVDLKVNFPTPPTAQPTKIINRLGIVVDDTDPWNVILENGGIYNIKSTDGSVSLTYSTPPGGTVNSEVDLSVSATVEPVISAASKIFAYENF